MRVNKNIISIIFYIFLFFSPIEIASATLKPEIIKNGMVVSEQKLASQIGVDILKSGGNAIDAAVAVGYALAVVNPCCGNLGGGGFMTLRLANGEAIFINFRERAPLAATESLYLDNQGRVIPNKSTMGYTAVAVPGTVLGLDTALKRYGTMTRQQVIAPAIKLAEKGYVLTPGDVLLLQKETEYFRKSKNIAAIFLKNNKPYQVGDRLVQMDLANTLKMISRSGAEIFYKGKIAKSIVEASQKHGGILSMNDFMKYHVAIQTPIQCSYRGYTIFSAPPPSSGGVTLCQTLNILENVNLKTMGYHSSQSVHYIVEALRYAFFDRNNQLGDPDFVENPITHLISKEYAKKIASRIPEMRATPSTAIGSIEQPAEEGVNTTHYSIIDKKGNAVSVTYTLNSFFGAKVIAGNTGFFLNNEMDDFTAKVGVENQFGLVNSAKNAIQPGKQPLSSMTPTIITQGDQVIMIVGSPGGPRIITATLQTILNVLDYGMNIQAAVNAPRFHHQWLPDVIYVEPALFSNKTNEKLIAMGYELKQQEHWGAVEAIYVDPITRVINGANDYRRPAGKAVGY